MPLPTLDQGFKLPTMAAAANLVVAGCAEPAGQPISCLPFMLGAFPLLLSSTAASHLCLGWRFHPELPSPLSRT